MSRAVKNNFLVRLTCWLIKKYQYYISPSLPRACRFTPSCSEYSLECFHSWPWYKAFGLTIWRLLRCHPFCAGGFDPVPKRK